MHDFSLICWTKKGRDILTQDALAPHVLRVGHEGGEGEGGMTVVHILIGMFNSNPMIPQYLNNNLT